MMVISIDIYSHGKYTKRYLHIDIFSVSGFHLPIGVVIDLKIGMINTFACILMLYLKL